jgi:hypothetical protein
MLSDDAILPRPPCREQSAERPSLPAHGNSIRRVAGFMRQNMLQ